MDASSRERETGMKKVNCVITKENKNITVESI